MINLREAEPIKQWDCPEWVREKGVVTKKCEQPFKENTVEKKETQGKDFEFLTAAYRYGDAEYIKDRQKGLSITSLSVKDGKGRDVK